MGLAGSLLAVGSCRFHLGPSVGSSLSKNECAGDRIGPAAGNPLVSPGSSSADVGLSCGHDGFGPDLVVLRLLGSGLLQQALRPELGPKQSALNVDVSGGRPRRHCRWMVFLFSAATWLDGECRTEIGDVG